jgi:hypothetical protein
MKQTDKSKQKKLSSSLAGALKALARRTGSLHQHPMPELREVGREWRRFAGNARPS